MDNQLDTSMQQVKSAVCHQHGHQLTSYNGDTELICRLCGSTLTEIRGDKKITMLSDPVQ